MEETQEAARARRQCANEASVTQLLQMDRASLAPITKQDIQDGS
jgi:hypothetical protein